MIFIIADDNPDGDDSTPDEVAEVWHWYDGDSNSKVGVNELTHLGDLEGIQSQHLLNMTAQNVKYDIV